MIVIARKGLIFSPNSFIYNPIVHFSSSRLKEVIHSPAIFDLLVHKHHFSHKLGLLASLQLCRVRIPKRADSVISFLKENSFTTAQMEKMILYKPRILGNNIDDLKLKFKLFHDLGLSSEEIAKFISNNSAILHLSTMNKIVPSLSVLRGLLGSNHDVAKLLRKCAWFISSDLEKILLPNVEVLKSCGIPMDRIISSLYSNPRYLLVKRDIMIKSIDKTIEIGVPRSSSFFLRAACVFAYLSESMWEVKMQTLRELGFSNNDALTIFKKAPLVFLASEKKMRRVIELLLATGKYSISNIINNPSVIGCSIEKRLEPRLRILGVLESRNLIERWPGLSGVYSYKDDKFYDRFVWPYCDESCKEIITKIYVQDKMR